MAMLPLVLASTSSNRHNLLKRLQLPFTSIDPGVDETPYPNETAWQLVTRLAHAKALAFADQYPQALLIGSDQVILLDGNILGKPITHANAVAQLSKASGKQLMSLTGLCLFNSQTKETQLAVETYQVTCRTFTKKMIENYLQKDNPYQCAGSFKAEGLGIALFSTMEGNDPTALLGLPLIRLTHFLEKAGINVL